VALPVFIILGFMPFNLDTDVADVESPGRKTIWMARTGSQPQLDRYVLDESKFLHDVYLCYGSLGDRLSGGYLGETDRIDIARAWLAGDGSSPALPAMVEKRLSELISMGFDSLIIVHGIDYSKSVIRAVRQDGVQFIAVLDA
jgi:hypothetical protein